MPLVLNNEEPGSEAFPRWLAAGSEIHTPRPPTKLPEVMKRVAFSKKLPPFARSEAGGLVRWFAPKNKNVPSP